jgi:hypothetical protein
MHAVFQHLFQARRIEKIDHRLTAAQHGCVNPLILDPNPTSHI